MLDSTAPEVVHDQYPPEVVPETSPEPLVFRRSSQLGPEPVHTAPHYKEEFGTYYTDEEQGTAPISSSHPSSAGYKGFEVNEHRESLQGSREKRDGRRYCGMRKVVCIWTVVLVVVLIVVAVVLGAVLGTVLPKQSSNENRLETISMTGLATTVSGNTLYHYFQNPAGKVLENSYVDGAWSLQDSSDPGDALVTNEAGAGSPLAAITYPYKGKNYRQIFFITSTGYVKTINRTETGTWGPSTVITQDTASSGSIALAACWSDQLLDGIRVYYASQNGYIQEVGGSFNGSDWTPQHGFTASDANAGVACSTHNYANNQYLIVYLRNPTTSVVDQWYHNFQGGAAGFFSGAKSWKNHTISEGSDIAVCSDGKITEYVFYQLDNNLITRGVTNPKDLNYQTFSSIQGARSGSKMAASYIQNGAMIMFQNGSSDSTMWALDTSREGVPIFNMAVG